LYELIEVLNLPFVIQHHPLVVDGHFLDRTSS
jgi:hypothetical protein